jgi:uncharacterized membrane protein (DUF2068 family)
MTTAEYIHSNEAEVVHPAMIDVKVEEVKKRPGHVIASAVMFYVYAGLIVLAALGGKPVLVLLPVFVLFGWGLWNLKSWARTGSIVCACVFLSINVLFYVGTGMVQHETFVDIIYFVVILGLLFSEKTKAAAWEHKAR